MFCSFLFIPFHCLCCHGGGGGGRGRRHSTNNYTHLTSNNALTLCQPVSSSDSPFCVSVSLNKFKTVIQNLFINYLTKLFVFESITCHFFSVRVVRVLSPAFQDLLQSIHKTGYIFESTQVFDQPV